MSGWRATFLLALDGNPVVHVDLDPRCISVDFVRDAPPVVTLSHVPLCRCGQAFAMLARATALQREDGSHVVRVD